jgi:biopolymer transport protein ExbD
MALAACSPQTYANDCKLPLSGWRTNGDVLDHQGVSYELKIDPSGQLSYSGIEQVTVEQLARNMQEWVNFNPVPQIILNPDPEAPCAKVRQVRNIMERSPVCQRLPGHFDCFEGERRRMTR